MINFLHTILKEYEVAEDSFWHAGAFTIWHFIYVFLIASAVAGAIVGLYFASKKAKKTTLDVLAILVLCIYLFDLFVRPIAQLEGDLEQSIHSYLDKLPFHICTVMAPLCVLAQHSKLFAKIKEPLVILGIVGPLMYITYPNGVFGDRFPFCYNTIQTMLYHGVLFAWGVLNLTTGETKISIKKGWYKYGLCIISVSLWALLGNMAFSDMSSAKSWADTGYDWFFQKSGAFYIANGELWYSILAPIAVAIAVYAVGIAVYGIYHLVYFIASKIKKAKINKVIEEKQKEEANV